MLTLAALLTTWLFDLCGDDPESLAVRVTQLYLAVVRGLQRLGLEINVGKSGFLM